METKQEEQERHENGLISEDEDYCDNPSCLIKGCDGNHDKSQYEKDEDALCDCVEGMREFYNMDLKEIFSIIWDRLS